MIFLLNDFFQVLAKIASICDIFTVLYTMRISLSTLIMTVILLVFSNTVHIYVSTSFHAYLAMCVQSFQYFKPGFPTEKYGY